MGDWIFLKLQPYVQQSVAQRASHKLSFKFFGPYKVLQKVGVVAYKLQLPPSSHVHPVVHVSQLKKALGPGEQVQTELPSLSPDAIAELQPLMVLDERLVRRGHKLSAQVRVSWQKLPESYTTWEELHSIHRLHPDAPAWGHAASQGGGIVTTFLAQEAKAKERRECKRAEKTKKRLARACGAAREKAQPN